MVDTTTGIVALSKWMNCHSCHQTSHNSSDSILVNNQLYFPHNALWSQPIYEHLTGAVVYTQIGPPITNKRNLQGEPVPIKIKVLGEYKEDAILSRHRSLVSVCNNEMENEMNQYFNNIRPYSKSNEQVPIVKHIPQFAIPTSHWSHISSPDLCKNLQINTGTNMYLVDKVNNSHFPPEVVEVKNIGNVQVSGLNDVKFDNRFEIGTEIVHATYRVYAHYRDYYIDVKENDAGMYVKLVEINRDLHPQVKVAGKIFMRMHTVFDVRKHLNEFHTFIKTLEMNPCKPNETSVVKGQPIKSEVIFSSNRRYYLDLVTNKKGSFLKIKQTTIPNGFRSSLVIGAAGLDHFYQAFTHMLMKFVTGGTQVRSLPQGIQIDTGEGNFYFDVGQNEIGVYVRISQVGEHNKVITVPFARWKFFRDLFDSYILEIEKWKRNVCKHYTVSNEHMSD